MTRCLALLFSFALLLWGARTLEQVAFAASSEAHNSAYEASPANTDNISEGASKIRATRNEMRERAETEMCFGTGFTDSGVGCPTDASATGHVDSGRARKGSARPFYVESTAPTTLHIEDANASDALDNGRLLCTILQGEEDGSGGHDGCRLSVYDDGDENATIADTGVGDNAWEPVIAQSVVAYDFVSTSDDGTAGWFDSADWYAWSAATGAGSNATPDAGVDTCDVNVPETGDWRVWAEFDVACCGALGATDREVGILLCDATAGTCTSGSGTILHTWVWDDVSNTAERLAGRWAFNATANTDYNLDLEFRTNAGTTVGELNHETVGGEATTSFLRCWIEAR